LRQLANGGRLVAPVGATWDQELVVIKKHSQGKYHRRTAGTVTFVPMKPGRN
jgi:protein-L-isoaspartate(D-aspartate) O-methyltransferase